jgi:hypothetical protein
MEKPLATLNQTQRSNTVTQNNNEPSEFGNPNFANMDPAANLPSPIWAPQDATELEVETEEGSESMAAESSTNASGHDILKQHHLLRPGDVDRMCDQQHHPGGLVAGFIGHRSVSILIGDSGLGKSPLAYQLGLCVAQGIPFLGMATEPGPVVYADYENGVEEGRNLRNNLLQFLQLPKAPDNFIIWTPDCGDSLDIDGICQDVKPSLLIVDSLRSHNPLFEHKDNAGPEMSTLRSSAYKHGTAILLVHHLRKPGQEGVPRLDDDETTVIFWLNQAAGHRSIVNQCDTRIATDLSPRVPDAVMIIRWHRRIHGEDGPLYIGRALNAEGEPIGYMPLVGSRLLGNAEQEGAFARLPEKFPFKEAKAIYGRADDPTRKWLLKCIAAGLIKQVSKGVYQRVAGDKRQ